MTTPFVFGESRMESGKVGRILSGNPFDCGAATALPASGKVAQQTTLDIGSPDNSETYSLLFSGGYLSADKTITVETDGSTSATELGDSFAAAIAADLELAMNFQSITRPSGSAQDVLLTLLPGITMTITAVLNPSTAVVVVATTAAADGPSFIYGRAAVLSYSQTVALNRQIANLSALAGPSFLTTLTSASSGDDFAMTFAAQAGAGGAAQPVVSFSVDGGADTASATTAVANAIAGIFPGATVTPNTGAGTITTAFPVGSDVSLISELPEGSSTISTDKTAGGSVPQVVIVADANNTEPLTIGTNPTADPGGQGVPYITGPCRIVVLAPDTGFTQGGAVFVETAAGSDLGRFFAVGSASRIALPSSVAVWDQVDAADSSLAVLDVRNFLALPTGV